MSALALSLSSLCQSPCSKSSLYRVILPEGEDSCGFIALVSTSPQSRTILTDAFVTGIRFTTLLRESIVCTLRLIETFSAVSATGRSGSPSINPNSADDSVVSFADWVTHLKENQINIVNILRGGLNFGLRDAVFEAYGWNDCNSSFISAQRKKRSHSSISDGPSSIIHYPSSADPYHITESSYVKLVLRSSSVSISSEIDAIGPADGYAFLLGDVVATGVSLRHTLQQLEASAESSSATITGIILFTVGAPIAIDIIQSFHRSMQRKYPTTYKFSSVIFLEGIFYCPQSATELPVVEPHTDLILTSKKSVLAPEIVSMLCDSSNLLSCLERCCIYDAGSRAFEIEHYLRDVTTYWTKVASLAQTGETSLSVYATARLSSPLFSEVVQRLRDEDTCDRIVKMEDGSDSGSLSRDAQRLLSLALLQIERGGRLLDRRCGGGMVGKMIDEGIDSVVTGDEDD